jgi:hypothetical protein
LTLGLLLVGGLPAEAQVPPAKDPAKLPDKKATPEKAVSPRSSLDELLTKALKDNPDLRVAEVKLHEAQANLNQARLRVVQKIVSAHQQLAALRATVDAVEAKLKRLRTAFENRVAAIEDVHEAESTVQKAKAEVAQAEAELAYLIGQQPKTPAFSAEGDDSYLRNTLGLILSKRTVPVRLSGDMAEKLRKALQQPIKLKFDGENNLPLKDVLEYLQERAGININLSDPELRDAAVTSFLASPVPLGAAFQFLEDQNRLRFVLRDYGIMVVNEDNVPPGAVLLQDFWKQDRESQGVPQKK